MRYLTPRYILEKHAQQQSRGSFEAATLFIDASGFSAATEVLMKHGQHGAEVLGNIMTDIFSPMVNVVYDHGGFVAGFGGDAFTAIFPYPDDADAAGRQNTQKHMLATGVFIQQHMVDNPDYKTLYGLFSFSVKVGMADGPVEWGILTGGTRQNSYYFSGSAVDDCAAAEHYASGGEMIATKAVAVSIPTLTGYQNLDGTDQFVRLNNISSDLPINAPHTLFIPDEDTAALFQPQELLNPLKQGEFRQTINVFISLDNIQGHEDLVEFMGHVFDLQARYGGFFNRIDFGDKGCNLLIFWGAPVTHENDVGRALNFILELQKVVTVPMRTGITYYISNAGYIGSSLREEYTCYSRGVNLAARHMMAAPWGEIWLDEELANRSEDQFNIQFVGEYTFKGFEGELPVFSLKGREEDVLRDIYEGRMIGRESEMNALVEAADPIYQGKFAGVMSVYGEAGMGKSRLVYEFSRLLTDDVDPVQWLYCPSDEIIRQSLNPFRYMLRTYFGQSTAQSTEENRAAFEYKLAELLTQLTDKELKSTLNRTWSFLGALVDLFWPDTLYEQLEPQLRFDNTQVALKALIKAESLRQPLIVELEDAQWLDNDSRQFVRQLTHNVDKYPFAIAASSREELPADMFDPAAKQLALSLNHLTAEGVATFAGSLLRRRPSPELVELLVSRTDGNPFYLEQVIIYLDEQGMLDSDLEMRTINQNMSVPTDVRAVLIARLDRLTEEVRNVVQAASVLGREFETQLLSQMLLETDILPRIDLAENASIWNSLNEIKYIFKHGLMRDAAYDMQLRSRLSILHRLAASALELVYREELNAHFAEIAYHYDRASDADMAIIYYQKAGEQARNQFFNEEAIRHLSRAIELYLSSDDVDPKELFDLHLGREAVYNQLARREEQAADLATLAKLAEEIGSTDKILQVHIQQANYGLVTSDYTAAQTAIDKVINSSSANKSAAREADARLIAGKIAQRLGNFEPAIKHLNLALEVADQVDNEAGRAEALNILGNIYWTTRDIEKASTFLQQALTHHNAVHNRMGEASCLNTLSQIASQNGDYLEAEKLAKDVLDICQEIGYRHGESVILRNLGAEYTDLGDYKLALEYLERALDTCLETDDPWGEAITLDTLGVVQAGLNNLAKAQTYLRRATAMQSEIGDQDGLGYTWNHLGQVQLQAKDWSAAANSFGEALKIRRELNQNSLAIDSLAGACVANWALGNQTATEEGLTTVLEWINTKGVKELEYPAQTLLHVHDLLSQLPNSFTTPADSLLEQAYNYILERSQNIRDTGLRQTYTNILAHARVIELHTA